MTMRPDEKAALLKRYSERLAQHGPTIEALGWPKPKHNLRYRVLLEYWLSGPLPRPMRVLDFGCGFGDLFGFARQRQMPIEYTGLDINPDLIDVARQRYPAAQFLCMDPFERGLETKFDVILSSGVHNYRIADNRGFAEQSFELFDRYSTLGFAANFLSSRVNFQNERNHYSAPEDVLALALRYSSRVVLRHDYMPFEFSIFADKRSEIDENLTVFLPFVEDCR
jgi:predicted TPR repeat methyltransferase